MHEPWFRADPAALNTAVAAAVALQPRMGLEADGERVVLRGRFDVREGGAVLEKFALEVEISPVSARHPPAVWEIGERIPRVKDPHHVNVDGDNSLCVVLTDKYWYDHPEGLSLAEFFEGPLTYHLAGQAGVLQGRTWPAGEWKHGLDGVLQFYAEVLGTDKPWILRRLLASEHTRRSKRQMVCPCGSGKKRRHCHAERLRGLARGPNFAAVLAVLSTTATLERMAG